MPKATLILVPGLVCDKTVWEVQMEGLSPQVDIIVPDLSQANTPKAMVEAVLTNAPDRFMLAGHSMGGWVALEVMREHNQRVTKLALLNTTAASDTEEKVKARLDLISLLKAGDVDVLVQRLLSVFVYQTRCEQAVKKMILRNLPALIHQEQAMLMRESLVPVLPRIDCQTMIISANQDKIFNLQDADYLKNNIKNAQLFHIDQCGHMSPMEAPETVLSYLKQFIQAD